MRLETDDFTPIALRKKQELSKNNLIFRGMEQNNWQFFTIFILFYDKFIFVNNAPIRSGTKALGILDIDLFLNLKMFNIFETVML